MVGKGNKRGKDCTVWKGGRCKTDDGYILIYVPREDRFYNMANCNHYVPEHRLIMAEHLGRCLNRSEIVHHLNGIRTDNRLINLALLNRNNHSSKTLLKSLQKRIRDLEVQLSQQKLPY